MDWKIVLQAQKFAYLFAATLLIYGCGDANNTNLSAGPPAGPEAVQVGSSGVVGKLFVGTGVPNARVILQTVGGTPLLSATTDATGNFYLKGAIPPNFRVVATLEDGLTLTRECRNWVDGSGLVAITLPSTLVSLLGGQGDLTAAEAQARTILKMPAGSNLYRIDESVSNDFSALAFLMAAHKGGGLRTYLQAAASSGRLADAPYVLRRDNLDDALGSLPASVSVPLEKFRARPQLRRAAKNKFLRELQPTILVDLPILDGLEAARDAVKSGITGSLSFTGKSIAGALISQGVTTVTSSAYTWVAQQMGWKFGTSNTIAGIANSLDDLAASVAAFQAAVYGTYLDGLKSQYNDDLLTVRQVAGQIQGGLNEIGSNPNYFDNSPPTGILPGNVTTVLGTVSNTATAANLTRAINHLQLGATGAQTVPQPAPGYSFPPIVSDGTGSSATLYPQTRDFVLASYGISHDLTYTAKFSGMGVRSNDLLDQIMEPLEAFCEGQVLGAQALSECAHADLINPAKSINDAQKQVENVARSVYSARSQFPAYALSDDFFIDLENGLMWYKVCQDIASVADARTFASNLSVAGEHNWHVPTFDELKTLTERAAYAYGASQGKQSADYISGGVAGFKLLGFQLPDGVDDQHFLMAIDWTYDNGLFGSHTWGVDGGLGVDMTRDQFATGATSPQPIIKGYFLVCRTLNSSGKSCIEIDPPRDAHADNPGTWPDEVTGEIIHEEIASIGNFWGFQTFLASADWMELGANWGIWVGQSSGYPLGFKGTDFRKTDHNGGKSYTNASQMPFFYYLTDDISNVLVSNIPGYFGKIFVHPNPNPAALVDAYTVGQTANTENYPRVIHSRASLNPTRNYDGILLNDLLLAPKNLLVDLTPIGTSGEKHEQQCLALAAFSDMRTVDVNADATFEVTDSATGKTVPGAYFKTSVPGELVLDPSAGGLYDNQLLTLKVDYNGKTDTTQFRISL